MAIKDGIMFTDVKAKEDSPVVVYWSEYEASERFENAKRWAVKPENLQGSLWAAFVAGWDAHETSVSKKRFRIKNLSGRIFTWLLKVSRSLRS